MAEYKITFELEPEIIIEADSEDEAIDKFLDAEVTSFKDLKEAAKESMIANEPRIIDVSEL